MAQGGRKKFQGGSCHLSLRHYFPRLCASASIRNEILRRIEGVTLFDKVHRSEIRKSLNIEPLHFSESKGRSQRGYFGRVRRMLQERLPKQAYLRK